MIVYGCWEEGVNWLKKRSGVEQALLDLVEDEVAGDPITGQRWVRRSLQKLKRALEAKGISLSCQTIRRILHKHEIRPKSNVKRLAPNPHPDRDQQFQYIQEQRRAFELEGWPIISVDTKKKELIGPFDNEGQVWCEQATDVYTHNFPSDALGKAVPYGIYDPQHNEGFVFVGQSADTPEFAVDAIVAWWQNIGCKRFPEATHLLISADSGGSDGYRPRRWKQQLQVKVADALGITVTVIHYPRGASKWNPIEHRLFSQISQTWAGTPLTSFDLVLDAIRSTTTMTGLKVEAMLTEKVYETGLSVSDDEMASLALQPHDTCPQWNYTISPRNCGVISR
jgi:hypothetical protein